MFTTHPHISTLRQAPRPCDGRELTLLIQTIPQPRVNNPLYAAHNGRSSSFWRRSEPFGQVRKLKQQQQQQPPRRVSFPRPTSRRLARECHQQTFVESSSKLRLCREKWPGITYTWCATKNRKLQHRCGFESEIGHRVTHRTTRKSRKPPPASPFSPSPHKIRTALAAFQGDRVESVTAKLASLAVKDNRSRQPLPRNQRQNQRQNRSPNPNCWRPQSSRNQRPSPHLLQPPSRRPLRRRSRRVHRRCQWQKIPRQTRIQPEVPLQRRRSLRLPPTRSATTTTRPTAHSDKPATRTTAVRSSAPTARTERSSTPSHEAAKKHTVQAFAQDEAQFEIPTRPVRLPASLVTPTAASAARTGLWHVLRATSTFGALLKPNQPRLFPASRRLSGQTHLD